MAPSKRPSVNSRTKLSKAKLEELSLKTRKLVSFLADTSTLAEGAILGRDKAVIITSHAANTSPSNLLRTLGQLGVNGISFQKSVFKGVDHAGFSIDPDLIPNASTTKLADVVTVIQNAPAKG